MNIMTVTRDDYIASNGSKMSVYLWNTFVTPAVPRVFQAVHKRGRHTNFPQPVSGWSGFDQQDLRWPITASEPVCQNTTGRTGADNDVVIFVGISDTCCRRRPPHGSVLPVVCITDSEFRTEIRRRNDDRYRRLSQWTIISRWRQWNWHSSAHTADFPRLDRPSIVPLFKTSPHLYLTWMPKVKHDRAGTCVVCT